jgi:hypothetical protein
MKLQPFCKVALALTLGGCSSQPSAVYQRAPAGADSEITVANAASGGDLFAMPLSKMIVASAGAGTASDPSQHAAAPTGGSNSQTKAPPPTSVATSVRIGEDRYDVSVVPIESEKKYLVRPSSDFWSTTQINITKIPNTDIPRSVATQFTDNTKTRIDEAAGFVTGVIALVPLLAAETAQEQACRQKPPKLEPFTLVISGEVRDPTAIEGQPCWRYTAIYVDKQPTVGAVTWARFDQDLNAKVRYFPVPACRDIEVSIIGFAQPAAAGNPSQQMVVAKVATRIADPGFVRLAPLPTKGQISMHPICGADISDTAVDRFAGYFDDVNELLKQAKTIEDASKTSTGKASTAPAKSTVPAKK